MEHGMKTRVVTILLSADLRARLSGQSSLSLAGVADRTPSVQLWLFISGRIKS